jgi:hypothetical protein
MATTDSRAPLQTPVFGTRLNSASAVARSTYPAFSRSFVLIESAKYLADISCVVILSNDFAGSGGK